MKTCKICGKPKSQYILNNRTVCLNCDDLVFDLEIECEQETDTAKSRNNDKNQSNPSFGKTNVPVKKP